MSPDVHRAVHLDTEATWPSATTKNAHLVEPTWGQSDDGGPPLTELTSESAGAALAVR